MAMSAGRAATFYLWMTAAAIVVVTANPWPAGLALGLLAGLGLGSMLRTPQGGDR